jgi:predicted amidophosphoribosyltransferase
MVACSAARMRELLIPTRCLACRARSDLPWCARCTAAVRLLPSGCRRCAAPSSAGHGCWPFDAPIDGTLTSYDYRGPVAAAVVAAKVGGAWRGWEPLAADLARRVAELRGTLDVVTWVTAVPRRVRQRGLDHARAIAVPLARSLEAPLIRLLDVVPGPDHAEGYRARMPVPGTDLLLVDDVLTSGATAWRAAAALRDAGAGRIVLATLARAGAHPLGAAPWRR